MQRRKELQKLNFFFFLKKTTFVEGLPDSFQDPEWFPAGLSHLVTLDDVIFQASTWSKSLPSTGIIET